MIFSRLSKDQLVRLARIIGFSAMAVYTVRYQSFLNAPTRPEVNSGRVVPYSVKGMTVYITETDSEIQVVLGWTAVGAVVLSILVTQAYGGDATGPSSRRTS